MNRQLRILSGLHRGAEVSMGRDERCVIGSGAECSIVLFDAGVARKHCVVQSDAFGLSCRALEAPVTVGDREIAPGEVTRLEELEPIRCGQAVLGVSTENADWSIAERALENSKPMPLRAVRSLRQLNPYALFASVLFGITCVIGLAYAALSDRPYELTPDRIAAARTWLKSIAPEGSELAIGADTLPGQHLLLTGYVHDEGQLQTLLAASRRSMFAPRVEVYSIEAMTAAMDRLSRLAQLPCQPRYEGAGQLACAEAAPSDAVAAKLRLVARDVPGLRALQVSVLPPPMVAAAPPPPVPPSDPARLTKKFSVLMWRNQRYLVGQYGERYQEGEEFDGFSIRRIGVDKILFERDGREFEFYVAALRLSQ
jgi:type III secretion system YscD/HrpQ family protein